jgi:chromosomal replication initiation ATPase DnaA
MKAAVRVSPYCWPWIKINNLSRNQKRRLVVNKAPYDHLIIMRTICEYFEVSEESIKGKSRLNPFKWPRHFYVYFCRRFTGLSFKQIGEILDRDHTTAMHSCQVIKDILDTDDVYRKYYNDIEMILFSKNNIAA